MAHDAGRNTAALRATLPADQLRIIILRRVDPLSGKAVINCAGNGRSIALMDLCVTGRIDLARRRVPSRKVYRVLFADAGREPGGVKVVGCGETVAFTAS